MGVIAVGLTTCLAGGGAASAAPIPRPASAQSPASTPNPQRQATEAAGAKEIGTVKVNSRPSTQPGKSVTKTPPQREKTAKQNAAATSRNMQTYGPITVPKGKIWWAYIKCGGGVAGGGELNSSGSGAVELLESRALDDGSGWQVSVGNFGNTDATFTTYAVCVGGLSDYNLATAKASVGGQAGQNVRAECTRGKVIGGGSPMDIGDGGRTSISLLLPIIPIDDFVSYRENFSGDQVSIHSQAVCANGVYTQFRQSQNVLVPDGTAASAYVACPSEYIAISGGGGFYSRGVITDSYPDGEGWRIYAKNVSGFGGARSMDAQVVCVPR
ncbi:hypothetical protein [Actinomadura rubrisoli]|uniref:Uncharacterized protein n=1 Tax=Actinomadura rubrisoli TaxID=2530368 RepID=A0A4V2YZD8_9ACTN|nr:hypothetical protein [Actinomadura rubrisoli]TDD96717.1 hypothetical protein E1298_02815 [Actinomadura rubrisoli]